MTAYFEKVNAWNKDLWKGLSLPLASLDLELTERCNNNCVHCYINLPPGDVDAQKRELSTSELKDILNEAASLGCLRVRFTGGEPLLREDFEELYVFARKLGLKVVIFTNATCITRALAELFFKIPPLELIEVTMFGARKSSYERITRSPGSFEAARRGMNLLLEKGVPFIIKGVLLKDNMTDAEELTSWTSTIPWMDGPPVFSRASYLRCRRDSNVKNDLIKRKRLSPAETVASLMSAQNGYENALREFCTKFMGPQGEKLFSCGAGIGGGCVDAYGNFQLCMMLRHPETVYDLRAGSLKEALEVFFPKIRETKASNPGYLKRCARCFLMGMCEQCPARSWIEYGTLDSPVEYLCEIAHAQARHLGLLEEGELGWEVKDWEQRLESLSGTAPGGEQTRTGQGTCALA